MGGRRSKQALRCIRCRMHLGLCICSLIPRLETRSRWVFVQHPAERVKTTNTARLAHQALVESQLCSYRGRSDPPDPLPEVGEGRDAWLLFPREGAEIVPPERLRSPPRPLTIFVLDGTWGQARRMARTLPQVRDLPVVGLPEGATARWSLRAETVAGGMATVDAVAWLLGALEGELAAEPLERAWQAMSDRTLASRGTPRPGGPRMGAGGLQEP